MDRKLIVTLLKKHIQELEMITEGFMEMTEYPKPIISLARKKTEDILDYISQLEEIKLETIFTEMKEDIDVLLSQDDLPIVLQEETEVPLIEETIITEVIEETTTIIEEVEFITQEEGDDEGELNSDEQETYFEPDYENEKLEPVVEEEIIENDIETPIEVQIEETVVTEVVTVIREEKSTFHSIDIEKNTIADTHNNKKIDDIRQAISIGDRFRFQRELFNGNGEVLNKTLSYLNKLSNFEEAHTYLQNKFKWDEEDETVESFYQIIKRRYL